MGGLGFGDCGDVVEEEAVKSSGSPSFCAVDKVCLSVDGNAANFTIRKLGRTLRKVPSRFCNFLVKSLGASMSAFYG